MMTPLTSREAIRANNSSADRQFIARQEKRSKTARADEKRVAALRRAFAERVEAQARVVVAAAEAAAEAARAAAEAGRALQALDEELREATRMEVGNDYADWHPDGLGGVFVALAARITTAADGVAGGAERVANDAARIVAGAGAFAAASAEASALAENE
jgi:hypothetical protein